MPELRKKLRTVSGKNIALQDILRSCGEAVEVISVEKLTGGVHNTKSVLAMTSGEQRVHFYNRVLITNTIPDGFISSGDIDLDIEVLNTLYGCDFTEDDLVVVCGKYAAKPDSLGYYSDGEQGNQGSSLPADVISMHLGDYKEHGRHDEYNAIVLRLRVETKPLEMTETILISNKESWYGGNNQDKISEIIKDGLLEIQTKLGIEIFDITPTTWHEAYGEILTQSYLVKIINPLQTAIEIAINIVSLDEAGGVEQASQVLLPNTRLSAKGSTLTYCPTKDMAVIRFSDANMDFNNPINGDERMVYSGEYLGVNGAYKNSYFLPSAIRGLSIGERGDVYIETDSLSPTGGLVNLVRTFVSTLRIPPVEVPYVMPTLIDPPRESPQIMPTLVDLPVESPHAIPTLDPDTVIVIMKNTFSTPVELNISQLLKPVQFAPHANITKPDEFFLLTPLGGSNEHFSAKVIIDGVEIIIPNVNMATLWRKMSGDPRISSKLEVLILTENGSDDHFGYLKNKTDKPVDIFITPNTEETDTILNIILEPKGTPGTKYNPVDTITFKEFKSWDRNILECIHRGKSSDAYMLADRLSVAMVKQSESEMRDFLGNSPLYEEFVAVWADDNKVEHRQKVCVIPQLLPRWGYEPR